MPCLEFSTVWNRVKNPATSRIFHPDYSVVFRKKKSLFCNRCYAVILEKYLKWWSLHSSAKFLSQSYWFWWNVLFHWLHLASSEINTFWMTLLVLLSLKFLCKTSFTGCFRFDFCLNCVSGQAQHACQNSSFNWFQEPSFIDPVQLQLLCQDSSINWMIIAWPPLPARSPGWLQSSCQHGRCQGCRGGWGSSAGRRLCSGVSVGQCFIPFCCWLSGQSVWYMQLLLRVIVAGWKLTSGGCCCDLASSV